MTIAKGEQIATWVQAAREGNRAAFGWLVRQFQDAVAGVVLARTGSGPDVEDITQDAFVAAWQQLGQLRDPAGFGSWVCGIARNRALRWQRDRPRPAALPEDIAAPAADPPVDLAGRVMAAVQALPERLREPLTLFYINGYSTEDVAGLLELPPGTVRRRLHEARHLLKEHMESLMEDQIKRNAPPPDLAQTVLDRITDIVLQAGVPSPDAYTMHIKDQDGRTFPIIVGKREGEALEQALGQRPPALLPLLYDMLLAAASRFGTRLSGIRVSEIKDHTFYARIEAASLAGPVDLDARPSDAINLAVRAKVPMQVVRGVTDMSMLEPHRQDALVEYIGLDPQKLDDLRRRTEPDSADLPPRLDLARGLALLQIHRAYSRPWPLPTEDMVRQAADHLAEARTLLAQVLAQSKDPLQRRDAAIWLGTVEFLEGRWPEAVAAFQQYDAPWRDLVWPVPLHAATTLHRIGRNDEALARLTDAVAAIDRLHGTQPISSARLVARHTLASNVATNMPAFLEKVRARSVLAPFDPPCLVVRWHTAPPFRFGPAYPLEGRALVIGSAPEADVQLNGERVSPRHARVFREADAWKVEDLGSGEGTAVDGEKIDRPTPVHPGGSIRLGLGRGGRGVMLLDMAACLAAPKEPQAQRTLFVHAIGEQPWVFPVPLADNFRMKHPDFPAGSILLHGRMLHGQPITSAETALPRTQTPPTCPGWPIPWPVHKISFLKDDADVKLTLTGSDDRSNVLTGPFARYAIAAIILAGKSTDRPMTEELTARFLAAAQVTCLHAVIGPPDASGLRVGRLHLRRGDDEARFDTDPIDAIVTAAAMHPVPPVWVCGAP